MSIWNHLNTADHLRRRAEGLIQTARKKAKGSAASNGQASMRTMRRQEMMNDLRHNAELCAMSGHAKRNG